MTEAMTDMSELLFNPFTDEHRADPYAQYARLREVDPVHRTPFGVWVASRYKDIERVLRDQRFVSLEPSGAEAPSLPGAAQPDPDREFTRVRSHWIVFKNGTEHTRLRRLMNKVFTPRAVRRLLPRIESVVDELLAEPLESGRMDVIDDLAYPLPAIVICELLGIPEADRAANRAWAEAVAPTFDPVTTPDQLAAAEDAMDEWAAYFRHLVEVRRGAPEDALFDAFITVEDAGEGMTRDEIVANSTFLFGAGHETTTNLIGNGTLALLRNPAELQRLRAEPDLVEGAVEELVRYDAPVQMTGRIAAEDTGVGDVEVGAGDPVVLLLGSANRDPEVYDDPDRLDIAREVERTLAFGSGAHYCLGASLARAEARCAFQALVTRTREISPATDTVEWRPMLNLRGLESLPVEIVPA